MKGGKTFDDNLDMSGHFVEKQKNIITPHGQT